MLPLQAAFLYYNFNTGTSTKLPALTDSCPAVQIWAEVVSNEVVLLK